MVSLNKACQWLGTYPDYLEQTLQEKGIKPVFVEDISSISQDTLDQLILEQDQEFQQNIQRIENRYQGQIERVMQMDAYNTIRAHLEITLENVSNLTEKTFESRTKRILRHIQEGKIESTQSPDGEVLVSREFTVQALTRLKDTHLKHIRRSWDQIKSMRIDEPFYELSEKAKILLPKKLQADLLSAAMRAYVTSDGTSLVVCLNEAKNYLDEGEELFAQNADN